MSDALAPSSIASAFQPTGASGLSGAPSAADQTSFSNVLARVTRLPDGASEESARDAAQQFVAVTLIQPILKQLRESNEAAPPFAPSNAEKQFRALMDAELAQRIARAAQFPLVDRLARDLLKQTGADGAPSEAAHATTNA